MARCEYTSSTCTVVYNSSDPSVIDTMEAAPAGFKTKLGLYHDAPKVFEATASYECGAEKFNTVAAPISETNTNKNYNTSNVMVDTDLLRRCEQLKLNLQIKQKDTDSTKLITATVAHRKLWTTGTTIPKNPPNGLLSVEVRLGSRQGSCVANSQRATIFVAYDVVWADKPPFQSTVVFDKVESCGLIDIID